MSVGDTFPKCPSCRKGVGWHLAVSVLSAGNGTVRLRVGSGRYVLASA